MFGLIRNWRRKRWAARPMPEAWLGYLDEHVPFFAELEGKLRERFLEYLKVFVWEKYFIGARDFDVTDEMKVVIAAAAVRLVLHRGLAPYNRLTEIVVYPGHYRHPGEADATVFGEAHQWGTVVLSWQAVIDGLRDPRDGHDTATHEFAHAIDRASGAFDGTPELHARHLYRPWAEVMSRHFLALRDGRREELRVLREYAGLNEAEFFAVATENFFERPQRMRDETPELYDLLRRFYGFDPAGREV